MEAEIECDTKQKSNISWFFFFYTPNGDEDDGKKNCHVKFFYVEARLVDRSIYDRGTKIIYRKYIRLICINALVNKITFVIFNHLTPIFI